jgi:hypothetical protein
MPLTFDCQLVPQCPVPVNQRIIHQYHSFATFAKRPAPGLLNYGIMRVGRIAVSE